MALSYKFIANEACFFSQISCPPPVSSVRSWLREDSAFVCALFRYTLVRKWTNVRTQMWERLFNRCTDVRRERGLFYTNTDFLKPPSSRARSKWVKCKYVIAILKRLFIFNVTPIGRVHIQEFDDVLILVWEQEPTLWKCLVLKSSNVEPGHSLVDFGSINLTY